MYWQQAVQCDSETDIGLRRKNNEDAAYLHLCKSESEWRRGGHLFVVADGMGGHAVGELASRLAVETVPHTFLKSTHADPKKSLHEAIRAANQAIHERGIQNADFLHMGTTCTALVLCSRGALVGHVGDSRAYRVRRDRVDQLTFDHSLEWELEREHGHLTSSLDLSQHRNIITRSLGPEELIDIDMEGPFPVLPGDAFVLCSDGLSNQVADQEIGAIVRELPPRQAARLLIQLANFRGGPDNATVIVVRAGELAANVIPEPTIEPPDERLSLGWSWLIGFALAGILLVVGLAMIGMQRPAMGGAIAGVGFIAFLGLFIASVRQLREAHRVVFAESTTHYWRPHRTAVGLTSQELYERLLQIEVELQRAAQEDGWEVNWTEHDQALQTATQAAGENRFARAIRDVAKAIGCIMDELPRAPRKQENSA